MASIMKSKHRKEYAKCLWLTLWHGLITGNYAKYTKAIRRAEEISEIVG